MEDDEEGPAEEHVAEADQSSQHRSLVHGQVLCGVLPDHLQDGAARGRCDGAHVAEHAQVEEYAF